jgi:hypothetical protein
MLHRIFASLLMAAWLWCCLSDEPARADNIQPACLEIEESGSGMIRVVWKVPLSQNIPSPFMPIFPQDCRVSSPRKRLNTGSAIVERWDMACGEQGLAGASIRIDGLEQTVMEALVRIRLADGFVHRVVLRPAQRVITVPDPASQPKEERTILGSTLRLVDRWRYFLLLPAVWFLSLRPRARKRGIVLCTSALLLGALCGHALGRLPTQERFLQRGVISEAEATRILQGLMLNTYRAFMLDEDEDVYDVLARSVAGEFLNEVYLENREAMRMEGSEGASTLIDRLDIKSIESMRPLKDDRIAMVATWDVYGTVSHLGHVHYRCNTYRAELTMVPTEAYWKLTGFQLLDEERII